MAEFRQKMGSVVPAVPKNNPPQSRTEFGSVSEFMQYLDDEYSSKKIKETDESASSQDEKIENESVDC